MRLTASNLVRTLVLCLFVAACGTSQKASEMPPAPEGVSEDVHRRCHWAGEAAGNRAVEEMSEGAETFSLLTGGLGAILALSAAEAEKEAAYKETYQDCLERAQD